MAIDCSVPTGVSLINHKNYTCLMGLIRPTRYRRGFILWVDVNLTSTVILQTKLQYQMVMSVCVCVCVCARARARARVRACVRAHLYA